MERRDFFKICALAGLGVAAPIGLMRRAHGDEGMGEGPFFLVFNADGGWDTSSLMDPKGVNGINTLYREGDILTQGAHRFAPSAPHLSVGMSNEAFFTKHGAELLTLNGLDYAINNHIPGKRYMATGSLDSLHYPTFAALIAAIRGSELPLAFVSFGNYSNTANLIPVARVTNSGQITALTQPDLIRGDDSRPYFEDDFVQARIQQALDQEHQLLGAKPQLPRAARSQSMLYTAQLSSRMLSRIRPHLPDEAPTNPIAQQAQLALAGFKAGISISANLVLGKFDTHNTHDANHIPQLALLLEGVDYALERAEALGIRDKLVIVVQSEMGRTPWYNNGQGKDHWSVGSAMFMGPGIRGNRVIGATDEGQRLRPVNPQTLALDDSAGIHVRPEHVHRALREYAGIEDHEVSARFPLNVHATERLQSLW